MHNKVGIDLIFSFRLPTDIQAESIPLILGGGDVLMVRITIISSASAYVCMIHTSVLTCVFMFTGR